jgi:hypothetical protein
VVGFFTDMRDHWGWLSRGREQMHWDVMRVTLPENMTPTAYAGWPEYREAVVSLVLPTIDVADYDGPVPSSAAPSSRREKCTQRREYPWSSENPSMLSVSRSPSSVGPTK